RRHHRFHHPELRPLDQAQPRRKPDQHRPLFRRRGRPPRIKGGRGGASKAETKARGPRPPLRSPLRSKRNPPGRAVEMASETRVPAGARFAIRQGLEAFVVALVLRRVFHPARKLLSPAKPVFCKSSEIIRLRKTGTCGALVQEG